VRQNGGSTIAEWIESEALAKAVRGMASIIAKASG
jgi:hypothetical protein